MAIAEQTPSKRQRDEDEDERTQARHVDGSDDSKRQKPYSNVLSLLDDEEEVPVTDLSSLITTLQQELSPEILAAFPVSENENEISMNQPDPDPASNEGYASSCSESSSPNSGDDVEDEGERVMRHLLEASDDELGIPQREVNGFDAAGAGLMNGVDGFSFGDGLWEFEDEAANYYTLVQSELFM